VGAPPTDSHTAESESSITTNKPWKEGGRSLSDVLDASPRRKSPFGGLASDSEFGPKGYPGA
jgi:hypothetical protein